jgi:Na+/H+ antiporter NhaD/arsenite permease-like protein
MTSNQTVTLAIFAVTYLALVVAMRWKLCIVLAACVVLLLWPGLMTVGNALTAVNWNVVMLYFGMLFVTEALILSGAPAILAERFIPEGASARWATLMVCIASGLISTVVENVAVVLMVAPVALAVAKRLNVSPAPMLIGIALCSNLQGAATMIGDPPSMLLAGNLNLTFDDFFWYLGRPGMFFAVELGAVFATVVLWFSFRKYAGKAPASLGQQKLQSRTPLVLLLLLVAALSCSSILLPGQRYAMGAISVAFGLACVVWWARRYSVRTFVRQARSLDWETGLFIVGIFVVVGSLVQSGMTDRIAGWLGAVLGRDKFLSYTVLVWGSVLGSAFIDNVPFVAAMLPVCMGMARSLGIPPELFCFGMMIGASVGGNITPIGASANIVAVGIAKRMGHTVGFREFMAVGFPFTIAGTAAVYLFLWLVWG